MSIYTDDLSLEDRRLFWRNYDDFAALFGAEYIDAGLMTLKPTNIVSIHNAPLEGPDDALNRNFRGDCWYKPNRFLGKTHGYVMFYKGAWQQQCRVACNQYLVPYPHQDLHVRQVITPALVVRAPWLAKFQIDIYPLRFLMSPGGEFYVRLANNHHGHRSLYVPYRALLAGDAEAIIKRNRSYFKRYTKADNVWESMQDDPVTVSFLEEVRNA